MPIEYTPEKELDVSAFGIAEPVIIKRWSHQDFAAVQRAMMKSNNVKVKELPESEDDDPKIDMDPGFEEDAIYATYGIKSGPAAWGTPIERAAIDALDFELVTYISQEVQRLNNYFFLERPPRGKARSRGSRSGGGGLKVNSESASCGPSFIPNATVRSNRRS